MPETRAAAFGSAALRLALALALWAAAWGLGAFTPLGTLREYAWVDGALRSAAIFVAVFAFYPVLARAIESRVESRGARYEILKILGAVLFVLALVAVAFLWVPRVGNVVLSVGLLGAALVFALQNPVASIAGWLLVVARRPFWIGDRIVVGGVRGDVVDMGPFYTTLMEFGEWIEGDLYTGRFVTVPNHRFLSEPVVNYSRGFPFLWDEIVIPVKSDSDWPRARDLLDAIAREAVAPHVEEARERLQGLGGRYLLLRWSLDPQTFVRLTSNWVQINLRYVAPVWSRRALATEITTRFLDALREAPGIEIASETFGIVDFPPLEVSGAPERGTTRAPRGTFLRWGGRGTRGGAARGDA